MAPSAGAFTDNYRRPAGVGIPEAPSSITPGNEARPADALRKSDHRPFTADVIAARSKPDCALPLTTVGSP